VQSIIRAYERRRIQAQDAAAPPALVPPGREPAGE
jgi:hypothetical protein